MLRAVSGLAFQIPVSRLNHAMHVAAEYHPLDEATDRPKRCAKRDAISHASAVAVRLEQVLVPKHRKRSTLLLIDKPRWTVPLHDLDRHRPQQAEVPCVPRDLIAKSQH